MTSTSEWPTATIKYRLHLASALHSVSPALAALHTSRSATLHPEISPFLSSSHCPRCGAYYFSGDSPTQLVRPARKKQRVSRSSSRKRTCKTCNACTTLSLTRDHKSAPVQSANTFSNTESESPPTAVATSTKMDRETRPPGDPPFTISPGPKVVPRASAPFKSKHSTAPTLQEMLARDHHRTETVKARKKMKERDEGLAAFLKDL